MKINKMAANEGPYTFDVNALGHDLSLNMTMTTAPEVGGDLTKLYFDGTFHAVNKTSPLPYGIKAYAPRFAHSHSEQFFIHQNTFNSLILTAQDAFFPIKITDPKIAGMLKQSLPEISAHYGRNTSLTLSVDLLAVGEDPLIKFN